MTALTPPDIRTTEAIATELANMLPVTGIASDYTSLQDTVITGLETGWTWFLVDDYDHQADGRTKAWASISNAEQGIENFHLTADTVRLGWVRYITALLAQGGTIERAMQDVSDTDALIADAVLQYAVFGKVVYG